jgi:FdhD protein
MTEPACRVPSLKVSRTSAERTSRIIPEEAPVALVYDGSTYAVMLATPRDLEDFALGFSLTEGVIRSRDEIASLEIVEQPKGIELRMWLTPATGRTLAERRRRMAGPTGCGLCGVESLAAALPEAPRVAPSGFRPTREDIYSALAAIAPAQTLNAETRAAHAAAFWTPGKGLVALREDVGRHNALDKLVGALVARGSQAASGIVVLTSRVSVEMVQKAAALGAPVIVAVSAPTALAIRTAEAAGITLIAVARSDAFEIFTRSDRVRTEPNGDTCREVETNAA